MREPFVWAMPILLVVLASTTLAQSPTPQPRSTADVFQAQTQGQTQSRAQGTTTTQSVDPNYIFQSNDYILVQVYGEDDLTTMTRVSGDGFVTLPLIGSIKIGGRSAKASTDAVRESYQKDYLVSPQISISMVEFAKRRYTVLGQVQKPGTYEIPQQETVDLLSAIGNAGGLTRIADSSSVTVRRKIGKEDKIFKLNAKLLSHDSQAKPFVILEGDVITVAESLF
jgi:polysaccharide export outer membrane protein